VDAVHEELRRTGAFSVDQVVERAGCAPATYYAHFPTKDDAVAIAFATVLDDLERLAGSAFGLDDLVRLGPTAFARRVERELVAFFRTESLVFRAALARLSEHRPIRTRYRAAEAAVLATIAGFLDQAEQAGALPGPGAAGRAEAVLVVAQGCNNPRLLRAAAADPVHDLVALALAATLLGSPPR